jgi:hypothetical protein
MVSGSRSGTTLRPAAAYPLQAECQESHSAPNLLPLQHSRTKLLHPQDPVKRDWWPWHSTSTESPCDGPKHKSQCAPRTPSRTPLQQRLAPIHVEHSAATLDAVAAETAGQSLAGRLCPQLGIARHHMRLEQRPRLHRRAHKQAEGARRTGRRRERCACNWVLGQENNAAMPGLPLLRAASPNGHPTLRQHSTSAELRAQAAWMDPVTPLPAYRSARTWRHVSTHLRVALALQDVDVP